MLQVSQSRYFKYGRVEIRARVSAHKHNYAALWLWVEKIHSGYPYQYSNYNNYKVTEIDIMETNYNYKVLSFFQTIHDWNCYPIGVGNNCDTTVSTGLIPGFKPMQWYVFSVERKKINEKNVIKLFINNRLKKIVTDGDPSDKSTIDKKFIEIGDLPSYIIMNIVEIAKGELGNGSFLDIDYVRIYEDTKMFDDGQK